MPRVALLDGLRGYFLVFMLVTHLFGGEYALVKVNHAELGFVQDAQGFVFLSGLLVGALYGRRMDRNGFVADRHRARQSNQRPWHSISCVLCSHRLPAARKPRWLAPHG